MVIEEEKNQSHYPRNLPHSPGLWTGSYAGCIDFRPLIVVPCLSGPALGHGQAHRFPLLSLASGPSGVPTPRPCESGANPRKEAFVTHLLAPALSSISALFSHTLDYGLKCWRGKKKEREGSDFCLMDKCICS